MKIFIANADPIRASGFRKVDNRQRERKKEGFGFIEMPVREQAQSAIAALHDKNCMAES